MLTDSSSRGPAPVRAYARSGDTNQSLQFDLDASGSLLFVGSKDSCVKVYDVHGGAEIQTITGFSDCCNGVSVSKLTGADGMGSLAVSTGQRHYPIKTDGSDCEGSGSDGEGEGEEEKEKGRGKVDEDEERGGTLSVLKFRKLGR
jgi:hypothetical protein